MNNSIRFFGKVCLFSAISLFLLAQTGCGSGTLASTDSRPGHGPNATPTPTPPAPNPNPAPSPSPTPGSSANFYVSPAGSDSNSGSSSSPWLTINHAAASVQPGDWVHVLPGTYGAVSTSVSGTASARIRFISDTKWGALIRTTGVQQMWYNTGNYVDIVGFDISGDGRLGILNMGSFVKTIGNHIHNIPAACSSNGGGGIDDANYSGSDDDVIGNVVHDIGPTPLGSCNTVQGIYHANLRGHIYNNIVYGVSAWGIQLWHAAANVIIANNLVFNNGGSGTGGGMIVGDGDSPGGVTDDNTIVTNNIIIHNGGAAIEELGSVGTHNVYANNILFQNWSELSLIANNAVGTLFVDPLLVNYQPDGSGDYHLSAGSPGINAGTSQGAPTNDFAGGARPIGGAYDIGPYEYNSVPGTWPWM